MAEAKVMEIQRMDGPTALSAISRVELDTVIATAKQYPRDIVRFSTVSRAMTLSTVEFAAQSFYALPRAGKWITGPSVRFAETLQHAWGNCRAAGRVVEEQDKFVVAQGVFIDCEANTMVCIEQKRRITDKDGNRYNADMIMTTGNAAVSIALRNAILKGVPKALWSPVYNAIEGVITEPSMLSASIAKALEYFKGKGLSPAKVCSLVQVSGPDKLGPRELFLLRGLHNSIEEGEISPEQAFRNAKVMPSMPREKRAPAETKPAQTETKPRKKKTKAAKAETPAETKPAEKSKGPELQVAKITDKQRANLFSIASKKSADYDTVQKIVRSALSSFGFKDSKSVTVDKYAQVCAALEGE